MVEEISFMLQEPERSDKPKIVGSEALIQAIETNVENISSQIYILNSKFQLTNLQTMNLLTNL